MARSRRRGARARPGETGQATVEFALVLPLVLGLCFVVLQIALVARQELLVTHAARVAVREASVTADGSRVVAAARTAIPNAGVRVVRRGAVGDPVEVEVTATVPVVLPFVRDLVPPVHLRERAVMAVER